MHLFKMRRKTSRIKQLFVVKVIQIP